MDAGFLWSDADSPIGSVALQAEDLVGLTVRSHDNWEDDDDWDDENEEGWDEEGSDDDEDDDEDWDDEDDEDWDDLEDEDD